jgi:hypothetical protein
MSMKTAASSKSRLTTETWGFAARAINLWKRLYSEFNVLMEEEHKIVQQLTGGERLYAYFTYRESGEFGSCWREGLTSEGFAARFELLATEGGIALGAAKGTSPLTHWLDCLLLDLRANKSSRLRMYNDAGGFVERLLEASALYCARLLRRSLEEAADTAAAEPKSLVLDESVDERSERRCAVVMPILLSKRWTRCRWSAEAGVSKNSVYDYLRGERSLTFANRHPLAEVLGLKPEELPD